MLIVLEGVDGCGKTTAVNYLADYLKYHRYPKVDATVTKDPGGTPLGSGIRKLLFSEPRIENMAPNVADMLFLASHVQNVHKVIRPALDAGRVVIADRYWPSQFAYAHLKGTSKKMLDFYAAFSGPNPNLMILLIGDVETFMNRALARTDEHHYQKKKKWRSDLEGLKKVQDRFLELYGKQQWVIPFYVKDLSMQNVCASVTNIVDTFMYKEGL